MRRRGRRNGNTGHKPETCERASSQFAAKADRVTVKFGFCLRTFVMAVSSERLQNSCVYKVIPLGHFLYENLKK